MTRTNANTGFGHLFLLKLIIPVSAFDFAPICKQTKFVIKKAKAVDILKRSSMRTVQSRQSVLG